MAEEQTLSPIKKYLQAICLIIGCDFEKLKFNTETIDDVFYCYVEGDKKIIAFLVGKNGKNAIAIRRILSVFLRKNDVSQRVKLIFGKK
jgi:predicted RNA-binding protein YlqC (UPF0109 family)